MSKGNLLVQLVYTEEGEVRLLHGPYLIYTMVSINEEVRCIGLLITQEDSEMPFYKFIDYAELDFSLESLNHLDDYLDRVRKNKKKLNNNQLMKVIIRCGTYLGDVIRKTNPKKFKWINYTQAYRISNKNGKKFLDYLGKDLTNSFILYDSKNFNFPLAKPLKFLENGREDSLIGFAMLCLGKAEKNKRYDIRKLKPV